MQLDCRGGHTPGVQWDDATGSLDVGRENSSGRTGGGVKLGDGVLCVWSKGAVLGSQLKKAVEEEKKG